MELFPLSPFGLGHSSVSQRYALRSGLKEKTVHDQFTIRRVPALFYSVSNNRCYAGHARVLGFRVCNWHNEIGGQRGANDWAEHRTWSCGFVALHHVTPGKKSTNRPGWSLTFAALRFRRIYGGVNVCWKWADMYRTGR